MLTTLYMYLHCACWDFLWELWFSPPNFPILYPQSYLVFNCCREFQFMSSVFILVTDYVVHFYSMIIAQLFTDTCHETNYSLQKKRQKRETQIADTIPLI